MSSMKPQTSLSVVCVCVCVCVCVRERERERERERVRNGMEKPKKRQKVNKGMFLHVQNNFHSHFYTFSLSNAHMQGRRKQFTSGPAQGHIHCE